MAPLFGGGGAADNSAAEAMQAQQKAQAAAKKKAQQQALASRRSQSAFDTLLSNNANASTLNSLLSYQQRPDLLGGSINNYKNTLG